MPKHKRWKESREYKRIQEVIDSYWIDEPEELYVECKMTFVKSNGEHQIKIIDWFNPDYEVIENKNRKPITAYILPIEKLNNPPEEDTFIPYLKLIRDGKIRKKVNK